jgi:hypothetical protein
MLGGKQDTDIDKISNRVIEIYSTSNLGIKESIAKAKEEYLKNNLRE